MSNKRVDQHLNPSGSSSGSIINNGTVSVLYLDIRNKYDEVDLGMHINNEENTFNNQMLYEVDGKDSDDSDDEWMWQL